MIRDPRIDPQPGDSLPIICDACKWGTISELYEPDCLGQHEPSNDYQCKFYAPRNKAEVVKEDNDER